MPNNLKQASPVGVFPNSLSTAFTDSRVFPTLQAVQNDGSFVTSLITDTVNVPTSIKSWKLTKRLPKDASLLPSPYNTIQAGQDMVTLRNFFNSHMGNAIPFYFYDFLDPDPGYFYDPTGNSEIGRYTVRFDTGVWTETIAIAFNDVSIGLMECA
jgi:hypothetical protein